MNNLNNLKEKITEYKKKQQSKNFKKEILTSFRVCTEIVSAIMAGLIIGSVLDKLIGTHFAFKIICLILGCIASFRIIYKLAGIK